MSASLTIITPGPTRRALEAAEAEIAELRRTIELQDAARRYLTFLFASGIYNASNEDNEKARDEWLGRLADVPNVALARELDTTREALERHQRMANALRFPSDHLAELYCAQVNWNPDGGQAKVVEGRWHHVSFRDLAKGYLQAAAVALLDNEDAERQAQGASS